MSSRNLGKSRIAKGVVIIKTKITENNARKDFEIILFFGCVSMIAVRIPGNKNIPVYLNGVLTYGKEAPRLSSDSIAGDLDGGGSVDSIDFAIMKKYLLGTIEMDTETFIRADVNGDKAVNSIDFALIKKYLLGIITSFPLNE